MKTTITYTSYGILCPGCTDNVLFKFSICKGYIHKVLFKRFCCGQLVYSNTSKWIVILHFDRL